jgi:hypothetical protein
MFADLSSLTVSCTGQFVNADGTKLTGTREQDVITPKSFFKACLFKNIDVSLNDCPLLSSPVHWQVVNSVMHALRDGYDHVESTEALERVYFDPEKSDSVVTLVTESTDTAATGTSPAKKEYSVSEACGRQRVQSYNDTKESRVFTVKGPLLPANVLPQQYIPNNVGIRIRLMRNRPEALLLEKTTGEDGKSAHKFQMHHLYLQMDYLILSQECLQAMELSFTRKPAEIPFSSVEQHQVLLPKQITHFRQDRVLTGLVPEEIIIVMVPTASLVGHASQDSSCFTHYNLAELQLITDEDLVYSHQLSVTTDLTSPDGFVDAFYKLCREVQGTPAAKYMTPTRYLKNGFIFVFRLTPERADTAEFGFAKPASTIGIRGRFSSPLEMPITLLLFSIKKNRLQIIGAERMVSIIA